MEQDRALLFCFIAKHGRGRPVTSCEVIVNVIAQSTTTKGLAARGSGSEPIRGTGLAVTDEELARARITPAKFHGEWNYAISPSQ